LVWREYEKVERTLAKWGS